MEDGYRCVAGPVKEAIQPRIRYERDWVKDPLPKKKTPKLRRNPTQTDEIYLSTNGHIDEAGRMDVPKLNRRNEVPTQANNGIHPSLVGEKRKFNAPAPAPERPAKVTKVSTHGATSTVETKFCHPIVFNYEDKTNGEEPCHFCAEAGYAIIGLGLKEVEVIEWEDGRGLEEISGGHMGDGVENTRVCAPCTLKRLPIIMCSKHELRPIASMKKDVLDENTAFAELLSGSAKASRRRWCAICPILAGYECCAPAESGSKGCGLQLCEQCMVMLTGLYDGDLQKMLPEMEIKPTKERMLGLRADYDLLREDGLLMRYVLWSSGQ